MINSMMLAPLVLGLFLAATPVIAQNNPERDSPIRPLPRSTGSSQDLQGLSEPKLESQPIIRQDNQQILEVNPNKPTPNSNNQIPEWQNRGEPRNNSSGVPLVNF